MQRFALATLVSAIVFAASTAGAQTVRFTTSIGAFDMALNPTGDDNLQPLVDNMLANIAAGLYHDTWVNRADPGFVLQLGGFSVDSVEVADIADSFDSIDSFDSVVVDGNGDGAVDFSALSNTRGTVSLALSAGNVNSGSSSFFVNVGDNAALDAQGFVPFAFVDDMTVVDQIMAAARVDVGPQLGQGSGNIAFSNAPTASDGTLIILENVSIVSMDSFSFYDPLLSALGAFDPAAAADGSGSSGAEAIPAALTMGDIPLSPTTDFGFPESDNDAASTVAALPEPSTLGLALLGAGGLVRRNRS